MISTYCFGTLTHVQYSYVIITTTHGKSGILPDGFQLLALVDTS